MNKTIKQIADELGIDKQKVYRYIKKNHINEVHQTASVKHYDETAQTQIKQAFIKKEPHHEAHQTHINDVLLMQLKIKDAQIEKLQKALDQEQQLHALTQTKLVALEDKQITVAAEKKRRWFWQKKDSDISE